MKKQTNAPLTAAVTNGLLVISIGIETLEFATRPENGGNLTFCKIDRRKRREFATDVVYEILREDEIGDTPLARFLDKMIKEAADRGSAAILWPQRKRRRAA